jgi:hypothetical protein
MIKALAATLAPFDKAEKPQVSPRLDASFIKKRQCAGRLRVVCGLAALHEGSARRRLGLQLCPFLLAFCAGAARRMHNRGALKLTSAAAVHHRAKLLIFTAGLMRPFRFVATVTILPQGILGSWCGTGDIDGLPQ